MSVRVVRDTDPGFRKAIRRMSKASDKQVAVGIMSNAGRSDTGASNAQIGAIHEYGLGGIPQRSFIRSTIDENGDAIFDMLKRSAPGIISGSLDDVAILSRIGLFVQGKIQQKIGSVIPAVPSGPPRTLLDTGQLRQSITFRVVQKGSTP